MQESFLYVISASQDGPVKLGISGDPEKRVRQLQTGHAERLHLHHKASVPADKALVYERLLHRDLGHLRVLGEWFGLTVEQAIAHVEFIFIEYDLVEDIHDKVRRRSI